MNNIILHREPMFDEKLVSIIIDYYFIIDVLINIRLKTVTLCRV